jgi:hypothetical protein
MLVKTRIIESFTVEKKKKKSPSQTSPGPSDSSPSPDKAGQSTKQERKSQLARLENEKQKVLHILARRRERENTHFDELEPRTSSEERPQLSAKKKDDKTKSRITEMMKRLQRQMARS